MRRASPPGSGRWLARNIHRFGIEHVARGRGWSPRGHALRARSAVPVAGGGDGGRLNPQKEDNMDDPANRLADRHFRRRHRRRGRVLHRRARAPGAKGTHRRARGRTGAQRAEEAERYRKEVDAHFDKTATLFVSMARLHHKGFFEHLSAATTNLSGASARALPGARRCATAPPRGAGPPPGIGAALAGAAGAAAAADAAEPTGSSADAVVGPAPVSVVDAALFRRRRVSPNPSQPSVGDFRSVCGRGGEGCSRGRSPHLPEPREPGSAGVDADAAERARRRRGGRRGPSASRAPSPRGEAR